MGIVSVDHIDRLFWLGRYTERTFTTTRLFADSYDEMIDFNAASYEEFCKSLDIPNIYESKEDFKTRYCFDEANPDSIYSTLDRAYDNAIMLRDEIGSEPLSYVQLAIYEMNNAKKSEAPIVYLMKVVDNIMAFWGIVDDQIESENVRNIIKVGKRVERIDLYARLRMDKSFLVREIHRLTGRINKTCLNYNKDRLAKLDELIQADELDYDSIINEIDNIMVV